MKQRIFALLLCLCLLSSLCGCSVPEEYRYINPTESVPAETKKPSEIRPTEHEEAEPKPTETPHLTARDMVKTMRKEELVAQLFLVKCPAGGAEKLLREFHVGGIILNDSNLNGETPDSLRKKLEGWQEHAPIPLIVAVNEEGGNEVQLSSRKEFRSERFDSPRNIYYDGSLAAVRETETEKAHLLKRCGINVNLAPVCDVASVETALMANRSLFQTSKITGSVISTMVRTMQKNQVGAVLKHFPGYGSISADTLDGKVLDDRKLEDLREFDMVPFSYGIDAGVGAVMMSHLTVISIDPESPASLSDKVIAKLRGDLGFRGVIMTDDLQKGAITDSYAADKAAIQAIQAGNDMIITDWSEDVYNAIVSTIGVEISREQLENSVERIIQWKMDLGLL